MIYYKVLNNATARDGADQIVFTPEGTAMGRIPGWRMLLDPDHLMPGNRIRNRAIRGGSADNGSTPINLGQFNEGETAFEPIGGTALDATVDTTINPTSWSLFCVLQFSSSSFPQEIVSSVDTGADGLPLEITYSAGGANMIIRSQAGSADDPRLSESVSLSTTGLTPQLFMFTFSERDGIKMYRNGEMIASDPTDTRPLTVSTGAGEWRVLRRTRGLYGMMGLLDIDLGWAEHAPYRRRIEQFMKSKYDIAEIPE